MNLESVILAHTGMQVTKTTARNCDSYDHEQLQLDVYIDGKFLRILWIDVLCPCEGVGTKIIEALKEYCKNNYLGLMAENVLTEAKPFWTKMGFRVSRELEVNYVFRT